MRKDFYIFRHGETDLNLQKRWQGSGMNFDLNETGIKQAQELSEKLEDKNIEFIFSSPLVRAKHTAEIAAEKIKVPVKVIKDLRECYYGDAEGKLISDLTEKFPDILNNWYNPDERFADIRFPNGESKREARDRVLQVMSTLIKEPYDMMGVAIHGGTMGQLLNYYKVAYDKIPNCAVFHLVYADGRWFAEGGIF